MGCRKTFFQFYLLNICIILLLSNESVLSVRLIHTAEVDFLQKRTEKVNSHYGGVCTEVLITNQNFYFSSDLDLLALIFWQDNYLRKNNPRVILSNDLPRESKHPLYRAPKDYIPFLLSSSKSTKRFTPSCVSVFVVDDGVFTDTIIHPGLITFSKSRWSMKTNRDHFIFLIGKAKEVQHKEFVKRKFGKKIREKISYSLELVVKNVGLYPGYNQSISFINDSKTEYPYSAEFSWKEIYKTSFTLSSRKSLDLKGRHLRAATVNPPQALLESKTIKETRTGRGIYYDYILNVEETFNCSLEYFGSSTTGSFSNVNGTWKWKGAVGKMLANDFDLTLINAMTEERLQVVEPSCPIQKQYMTFKVRIPSYSISWFAPLKPLGRSVWLWVFITLVCFSVIFLTVKYAKNVQSVTVLEIFSDILKLMLLQGINHLPKLGYCVLGLALIFSILISTCYNSKLVSFLTHPVVDYPKSLKEINSSDDYKVYGVYYGSIGQLALIATYGALMKRMIYVEQFQCIKNMLEDTNSVCIDYDKINMHRWESNFTLNTARDFSAKIYSFSQSPIVVDVAVTFPKDWIYSHEFIKHAEILFETGLLDFWSDHDARKVRQNGMRYLKSEKSKEVEYLKVLLTNMFERSNTTLKMHHIFGILVGWAILLSISILLFLCEKLTVVAKDYHLEKIFANRKPKKPLNLKDANVSIIFTLIKSVHAVVFETNNLVQIIDEQSYPIQEP